MKLHMWMLVSGLFAASALALLLALQPTGGSTNEVELSRDNPRLKALEAFDTIYSVLQHPRCVNCHFVGEVPRVGDDSRLHDQNVMRGRFSTGRAAMECHTCHKQGHIEFPGTPPGVASDNWRAAPRSMIFEGKSKVDLARQLKSIRRRDMRGERLAQHFHTSDFVKYGWNPGLGRRPVDIGYDAFLTAVGTWVDAGMPLPSEQPGTDK